MSTGLDTTFKYLAKTENEAAVDVLVAALDCPAQSSRNFALQAVLERRTPAGHRAVFQRLPKMDESAKAIIDQHPDRIEQVIATVLNNPDAKTCKSVCGLILAYRLYDAMPVLTSLLLKNNNTNTSLVADTILQLTDLYYADLSGAHEQSKRKDQLNLRDRITSTLEKAARKFHRHNRKEVVEALLIVARPNNAALRQILQRSDESCHGPASGTLCNSERGGVLRLVLGFLEESPVPRAIVEVLSRRQDPKFVENLLRTVGPRPSKQIAKTLSQVESFAWAQAGHEVLDGLDEQCQEAAVGVLMASTTDRREVLEVIGHLLSEGNVGGRRAAATALSDFQGAKACGMLLRSLNDEDAQVRANLLVQFRQRKIPGAFTLLVRMIDGAEEVERAALRMAMPEFTLDRFLHHFDSIEEGLRPMTGQLVRQINDDVIPKLTAELKSPSPVRRRRAVMAASAMGVVSEMEADVLKTISDADHTVRVAVARALADCKSVPSWEVLREALLDTSPAVKEAAEQGLQRISHSLAQQLEEGDEQKMQEQIA
ncbi:MAG: HEAT repeat domain-containing protein [Thermoguttaceae bacterium]